MPPEGPTWQAGPSGGKHFVGLFGKGEGALGMAVIDGQPFGVDRRPRRAAMVTRSGSDSAFILRIT